MASFVNVADALAAAIEIERRGHKFYRRVEELASTAKDKDFFGFMASEEKRHEDIFMGLLKGVGGMRLPDGSSELEYLDYLKVMLDKHSLFVPDLEEQILERPLRTAMQFEKDTLLYFIELERLVPDAEKAAVRQCADEERKHIMMLGQIRHLQ